MIPIKNACFYYPKNKGIIVNGFMSFSMIFSGVLNMLGEIFIVNPSGDSTIDIFYLLDISKKITTLFLYFGIINSFGALFGVILFKEYNPSLEIETVENALDNEDSVKKVGNYLNDMIKIMKNYRINTFRTFVSLTQTSIEDGKLYSI